MSFLDWIRGKKKENDKSQTPSGKGVVVVEEEAGCLVLMKGDFAKTMMSDIRREASESQSQAVSDKKLVIMVAASLAGLGQEMTIDHMEAASQGLEIVFEVDSCRDVLQPRLPSDWSVPGYLVKFQFDLQDRVPLSKESGAGILTCAECGNEVRLLSLDGTAMSGQLFGKLMEQAALDCPNCERLYCVACSTKLPGASFVCPNCEEEITSIL